MFLLRNQQRNVERARKHRFPPSSTPYLIPFLAFSLSFPIRINVSSFSARKDPSRGFSIPFSTRVEPRMNAYIYILYVYMYVYMYKRRDERRITRAREQRRHVHGGKLRPRSHIHRLAPRYSRSWYVGILNALHTVTCRRHCSLHPSRLHLPPLLPAAPDSLPARPHQHALS